MNTTILAAIFTIGIPIVAHSQAAPTVKPYEVPLQTVIKELNGDPAKDCIKLNGNRCAEDGTINMTVGRACAIALNTPLMEDRSETVERAIARGILARQILDAPKMVLNDAEVTMILDRMHKLAKPDGTAMFPSAMLAQIAGVIRENFKPEEIK